MSDTTEAFEIESARKRAWRGFKAIIKHGAEFGIDLSKVDINRLRMDNGTLCILGQGGPDNSYTQTVEKLHALNLDPGPYGNWKVRYGLDGASIGGYRQDCEALTDAWREILTNLRAVSGTPQPQAPVAANGFVVNADTIDAFRQAYVNSIRLADRRTYPELVLLSQVVNMVPATQIPTLLSVLLNEFKVQIARRQAAA